MIAIVLVAVSMAAGVLAVVALAAFKAAADWKREALACATKVRSLEEQLAHHNHVDVCLQSSNSWLENEEETPSLPAGAIETALWEVVGDEQEVDEWR